MVLGNHVSFISVSNSHHNFCYLQSLQFHVIPFLPGGVHAATAPEKRDGYRPGGADTAPEMGLVCDGQKTDSLVYIVVSISLSGASSLEIHSWHIDCSLPNKDNRRATTFIRLGVGKIQYKGN